jgi:uncharacterized cupin superfamily protein
MPKIQLDTLPVVTGAKYPAPFNAPCLQRMRKRLGDAAGLTQFGVNLLTLKPGVWSSQRHWHTHEDEFVYVLAGEVVLVTGAGEQILRAGDAAGFPGGEANGHCLQNRSDADALVLEVGSRIDDDGTDYPDIDLKAKPYRYSGQGGGYTRKNGEPY